MAEEQTNIQIAGRIAGRALRVVLAASVKIVLGAVLVAAIIGYQQRQVDREVQRAKDMINVLGTAQMFVDYEKARK